MSYILDALKKADSQRERDPARGIHAQPVLPAGGSRPTGERYRAWLWGAGAVGLAAAGAVGWYSQGDQGPVLARSAPVAAPVAPVAAAAAAVPVVAPAAAVVAVTPEPAIVATAVMPPAPPPAAVLEGDEPIRERRPKLRGRPQQVAAAPTASAPAAFGGVQAPAPGVVPNPAAPSASAPAAAASAAAPQLGAPARPPAVVQPPALINPPPPPPPPRAPVIVPTPPVAGLPSDAPKLVITGGVYSTNPAQRMLIVNGQVMNQGADLGSGVTLEEIKPKAAVLLFRGSRYSIAY